MKWGTHWSPSNAELQRIRAAVEQAERRTSGEIRVHLESRCREDVLDHAAFVFHKLGMDQTEARNGVLLYLAYKDRKFAVLGDVGIHRHVPPHFWDEVYNEGVQHFQNGDWVKGLESAIAACARELEVHFPVGDSHADELSNEVSWN
jgi:uncharacterized membrane protein